MIRFLILIIIAVALAYTDTKLLYGFVIALVYSIVCGMLDSRKEKGDC